MKSVENILRYVFGKSLVKFNNLYFKDNFLKYFHSFFFSGQPNQLGQHILIQQPGGNPILVMQPSAPQTQTIMPTMISTSTGQGTILLQVSFL